MSSAQPVTFKEKLKNQQAEEGASVTLHCELSKAGVTVEWKKGTKVLKSGERYQMKQKETVAELLISQASPEDSGDYSCICGDQKTTASLSVKGRSVYFSIYVNFVGKKKYFFLPSMVVILIDIGCLSV